MDYDNDNHSGDRWAWEGEDCYPQKDSNCDISQCLLSEVTLNEEDISYMFDETTPLKACGDFAYHVNQSDGLNKEPDKCRETSSQLKRRRMLQFDTPLVDSTICNEDFSCAFLKSNERLDSLEEFFPQASQWVPGFSEDGSASSYEGLDQSSEGWLAECFNDAEMNFGSGDMNYPGASDFQIDISEFCNESPVFEANVVQKCVTRTPKNIIFKGRKSFIQTPTKLASSVAYPFAFVKPCGVQGDVTLKDINQRIHTPSKPKQNDEDPAAYPTSAFSGKPVVGKTKIRTGGKGSITIMRTKG